MNGAKTRSATLQVRSLRSLGNSSERRAKFYLLYDLLERVSGDVAGTKIGSSGVGSVGHEKKAVDSCREVRISGRGLITVAESYSYAPNERRLISFLDPIARNFRKTGYE